MRAKDESSASFRVVGDTVDPARITSALGNAPSLAHTKGEPMRLHPEIRQRTGVWLLDSNAPSIADLDTHIRELIEKLRPRSQQIRQLRSEGHEVDFYCFIITTTEPFGIMFPPDILRDISDLGATLGLSINISGG